MKLAIILLVFSSSLFHEVFSISVVTNSDSMVLGFVLVAYGKLPLLAIAMVGIAAAVYDFHVSMKTKNNTGGGMTDGI